MTAHILEGIGAPTFTPSAIGQQYCASDTKTHYMSKGTASSADWVEISAPSDTPTSADLSYRNNMIYQSSGSITYAFDPTDTTWENNYVVLYNGSSGTNNVVDFVSTNVPASGTYFYSFVFQIYRQGSSTNNWQLSFDGAPFSVVFSGAPDAYWYDAGSDPATMAAFRGGNFEIYLTYVNQIIEPLKSFIIFRNRLNNT